MLGHKSAKVTLDTYVALFPDDFDNVTDALSCERGEQVPRWALIAIARVSQLAPDVPDDNPLRCHVEVHVNAEDACH